MSDAVVHKLEWDVDRFQVFLYDLPDPPLEMFLFGGTPRLESWVPQPIYVEKPRLEPPDIWHLVGAALLLMNEDVIAQLEPFVSRAGELLPFVVAGTDEEMFGLNILEDIDCLAPGSYSLDGLAAYPDFVEHRLPETGLFKVPILDTVDVFSVERSDDDDSFRRRVEANGLRGLSFCEVWSTTSGAQPVNLFNDQVEL